MISNKLREFVDRVLEKKSICETDLADLNRNILADGVADRDTVDVLVALDRAIATRCAGWSDYLVAVVVDFAVWASRPTGVINAEAANWLVTTLSAGQGPNDTAARIAFSIVREAEQCDERLITFAMSRRNGHDQSGHRPAMVAALVS